MNAKLIYEFISNNSIDVFKEINIENTSLRRYIDAMFAFLIREIPPEEASEFLDEYEDDIKQYYLKGMSAFSASIKLRQSYEKYLHRFDPITETINFKRGIDPKDAMGIGIQQDNFNDAEECADYILAVLTRILHVSDIDKDIINTKDAGRGFFKNEDYRILHDYIIQLTIKNKTANVESVLRWVHKELFNRGYSKGSKELDAHYQTYINQI